MIFKKKLIFILVNLLIILPLVLAGNYGAGAYGSDFYGVGEIIEVPIPDSPSGGGGGGGTTCDYNWQCTDWFPSECPASGFQERICINKGSCNGIQGIPQQTQTCEHIPTEPLFDIFLTLPNKEICSGEEVTAKIKLENYGKIELLDAFMTYWIIDENSKLIVELKDTRAVKDGKEFEVGLIIPKSIPNGTYRLYSKINYDGNKTALAGESFEIVSSDNCELASQLTSYWKYGAYVIGGIVMIIAILFILIRTFKKKGKKYPQHKNHKKEIRKARKTRTVREKSVKRVENRTPGSIKNIRDLEKHLTKGKTLIVIILAVTLISMVGLLRENITGFAIKNSNLISGNLHVIIYSFIILGVFGLLIFNHRKKIIEKIETKKRGKYPKDSLKGLIKKKVYTEDGDYVGKIEEVFLGENKIDSVGIRLDKKQKSKIKRFTIKYKDIIEVGEIVITYEEIFDYIENN